MKNEFVKPDWAPRTKPNARILVTGGTGGLGGALVNMLLDNSDCTIGVHGGTQTYQGPPTHAIALTKQLHNADDCEDLVDSFVEKAGQIDALVVLSGGIHFSGHWKDMPAELWEKDVDVNLNHAFYLARAAMAHMSEQGTGGKILLTGTESAIHGGSSASFPYAIAKRGTECLVQGLAREGAPQNILVNGLRFGYIKSGFHQRWHNRSPEDMIERANLVPLKRGGDMQEAAALMIYLLSGWSDFITGQMIPLTGGDWL